MYRLRYGFSGRGEGGWCDIDPNCNGWNKYLAGTPKDHKKYSPPQIVIGKV
jgi:hypothetical protein